MLKTSQRNELPYTLGVRTWNFHSTRYVSGRIKFIPQFFRLYVISHVTWHLRYVVAVYYVVPVHFYAIRSEVFPYT